MPSKTDTGRNRTLAVSLLLMLVGVCGTVGAKQQSGVFKKAAVASDAGQCSEIGRDMLKKGGSAVDAAIAAFLCVGLVNFHSLGIGGGGVFTIYDSKTGKVETINGQETAPLDSSVDMLEMINNTQLNWRGGLTIAIPGELRTYEMAHKRHGKLPWRDLFQPSIRMAEEGFPIGKALIGALYHTNILLDPTQSLCEYFCKNSTHYVEENDTIRFPELAQTYRKIAEGGADAFYEGELAQTIVTDIQSAGGVITMEDLRDYKVDLDESPVRVKIGEYTVVVPNAPAGGPVVATMLNILNGYNFSKDSVETVDDRILTSHRMLESFRFAYAKRSNLGDPKFNDIEDLLHNLTSPSYGEDLRAKITDSTTQPYEYYEPSFDMGTDHGTSHVSVIAEDGSAVSATSSINLVFGSKVVSKRTGILFNNKMTVFSIPNLIKAGVGPSLGNFIQPGKKPLASMSPAIILDKNNKVKMVVGASGAKKIPGAITQVILNTLLFGHDLESAILQPRFHNDLMPGETFVEPSLDQELVDGLVAKNHEVVPLLGMLSIVQAVVQHDDEVHAQSDPRKYSHAAGY